MLLVNSKTNDNRFKKVSLAIIAGYIADFVQVGITNFLHDLTNTELKETERSVGILSSWIVIVSMELVDLRDNIIQSSFFASGLALVVIAVINNLLFDREIDYEAIGKNFIINGSAIAIMMTIYKEVIQIAVKHKKKHSSGVVYKIITMIITSLPIIIYFAFKQFLDDLKTDGETAENN